MVKAQGAIELASAPTAGTCRGQGATEYLVLLAVVLIVALVSVALLGFFPEMASDAQITQSKAYWASMQPIAVSGEDARSAVSTGSTNTYAYIRLKNNGAYPIRITKVHSGSNYASIFYCDDDICHGGWAPFNMSDWFYLAPGEETYFGRETVNGNFPSRGMQFTTGTSSGSFYLGVGGGTTCQNSTASPGMLRIPDFGFEYIEYIDGQQITKKETGAKPLLIKCREPG